MADWQQRMLRFILLPVSFLPVTCLLYTLTGLLLAFIPVFQVLHVESSAVIAGLAFFFAGTSSVRRFAQHHPLGKVLQAHLTALAIPWLLLTLTLIWVPNCAYGTGLLFYLLFPPISVMLAVGLSYFLVSTGTSHAQRWFWGIGLGLLLLTPLYDLGLHPQFYVYNHVFGGILGPIYDEELALRPGLIAFRVLTLLWAALFVLMGHRRNTRSAHLLAQLLIATGIGACYLFAASLGINTTARHIQQTLGGHLQTPHFDLYYAPDALSEAEQQYLVDDMAFRYTQLSDQLGLTINERIAVYLYPDAETKAQLTGARYTNVAPVWLAHPQVHVLQGAYTEVFPHELVHVFSRPFGLPLLRASWSVGLVEGLAVALEPPDGLPSPHEQVIAAALRRFPPGQVTSLGLAQDLATRLSPLGFWTSRGAVSYTTMGSFVRFLIDTYGAPAFMAVYARGNFEAVYGKTPEALATEWEQYLLALPVLSRAAAPLASRRFAIPSLFEKACPHHIPAYQRAYREGLAALAEGDTTQTMNQLDKALVLWPAYPAALSVWSRLQLIQDEVDAVILRLDTLKTHTTTDHLYLGDAYARNGHAQRAQEHYSAALGQLPLYAHSSRAFLILRLALANNPAALDILYTNLPLAEQAEQLQPLDHHAGVAFMQALLYLSDDHYQQALNRLQHLPDTPGFTTPQYNALMRQRMIWLSEAAYRSAAWSTAITAATEARTLFLTAGDLQQAALLNDLLAKIQWLQHQER